MRLTYPTIAIAAATFAATLAFAPAIADAAQALDLSQFWTAPTNEAPAPITKHVPNCTNTWSVVADALGEKECHS
jgi:hypothetical protein